MNKRIANAIDFMSYPANSMEGTSVAYKFLKKYQSFIRFPLLLLLLLTSANSASASLEIVDFFSDYTSSEVTIRSSQDHHGKAVFQLLDGTNVVESQEVPFKASAGEEVSKIILWQNKPQHDYYTAKVSIFNDTKLHDNKTYPVSYGTVAMPSFHVVDFSPSNKGVQLLLRPFNPSVVDIKIELLDSNDIVYAKTQEDVSLTSNTELKIDWPFLLNNKEKYTVRTKILTHRLYAEPLINTYVSSFTAGDDVEILPDDVEVDEYGASVTLRGESQVPFDGFVDISAINRATNKTKTYRQQVEEILVTGKEDTAGVVWKELGSGTYDVSILAVNKENKALDKYETVLRIPEVDAVSETPATSSTPSLTGLTGLTGFVAIIIVIAILAVLRRKRGG
ncbi:MAG: hypothetical protein OIN66_01155 [Candidatus Methanoperedens sp.]|nr:hypothetical protein [Candidatus Methanoperedens sp.]